MFAFWFSLSISSISHACITARVANHTKSSKNVAGPTLHLLWCTVVSGP